jgi:hypothetical protein
MIIRFETGSSSPQIQSAIRFPIGRLGFSSCHPGRDREAAESRDPTPSALGELGPGSRSLRSLGRDDTRETESIDRTRITPAPLPDFASLIRATIATLPDRAHNDTTTGDGYGHERHDQAG